MKIIAGLGNPGRKYEKTRHNIGFDVAREIASRIGGTSAKSQFEAEVVEANYGGEKILILCPQTFMNLSGRSIRAAISFYKLSADDLIVISDDLNLPTGKLRLRANGSAGGQKGLADTISHLGTDKFARIRVGIDRPPPGYEVIDYVLGKFSEDELAILATTVTSAADAALLWAKSGIAEAMNRYNASPETKKSRKKDSRRQQNNVIDPSKAAENAANSNSEPSKH